MGKGAIENWGREGERERDRNLDEEKFITEKEKRFRNVSTERQGELKKRMTKISDFQCQ